VLTVPGDREPRSGQLIVIAAVAVALLVFRRALLSPMVFYERDIAGWWYPHVASFVRVVASGAWPLWDPSPGFGGPMWADPNYQVLYPFTWLNLILPPAIFYKVLGVFHVAWSFLGLALFLRRRGMSLLPSLVGGIAWATAGSFLSLHSMSHHFCGAAWAPWVLLAVDTLLVHPTPRSAALLGGCVGLQLLAGSLDMVFLTMLLAATHAAATFVSSRGARVAIGQVTLWASCAGLVGVGLAAAQWLPTLEVFRASSRGVLQPSDAMRWAFHPATLPELVAPSLLTDLPLRHDLRRGWFEGREPFLRSTHIGWPILLLAGLGLAAGRGRARWAWGVSGAVLLMGAMGPSTPVYPLWYWLGPGRVFRYPYKWMVGFSLAVAVLAALGMRAFLESWHVPARRRALALALGVLALAGAGAAAGWGDHLAHVTAWLGLLQDPPAGMDWREPLGRASARLVVLGSLGVVAAGLVILRPWIRPRRWLWSSMLGVILLCRLWDVGPVADLAPPELLAAAPPALSLMRAAKKTPRILSAAPRRPLKEYLSRAPHGWRPEWAMSLAAVELIRPVSEGRWGLRGSYDGDPTGLGSMGNATATRIVAVGGDSVRLRMLQLGAVDYVLTLPGQGWDFLPLEAEYQGVFSTPVQLRRVPQSLPLARFVRRAISPPSGLDAVRLVLDPGFDPRHEALVAAPEPAPGCKPTAEHPTATLRATISQAGRVDVDFDAACPGFLVVGEAYYPGWQAWIDGQAGRVLPADFALISVPVPAGRHHATLAYRPSAVMWGLVVALGSLLVAVVLAGPGRFRSLRGGER
jgi:hypothetical protein